MARWAPAENDTMTAIAQEIEGAVGTSRTIVAIDGEPGTNLEHVAAALVRAFESGGIPATSAAVPTDDVDRLRADLVAPFRSTGESAGVLVVWGEGLLGGTTRTLWNWTMWVEQGHGAGGDPKTNASAVLDVSDPEHPRRNWNDAC